MCLNDEHYIAQTKSCLAATKESFRSTTITTTITITIENISETNVLNWKQCYPGMCGKQNVLSIKCHPRNGQSLQFSQLTQISRNLVNFFYIKNMQSLHIQILKPC